MLETKSLRLREQMLQDTKNLYAYASIEVMGASASQRAHKDRKIIVVCNKGQETHVIALK